MGVQDGRGKDAADLHPGVRAGSKRQCQALRSLQDPAHAAAHDVPMLHAPPAMLSMATTLSACLPAQIRTANCRQSATSVMGHPLVSGLHGVDEALLQRLLARDGLAGQHHARRSLHAHQPRQPLRAAKARDDACTRISTGMSACTSAVVTSCCMQYCWRSRRKHTLLTAGARPPAGACRLETVGAMVSPSCSSGKPILASAAATRALQDIASSQPPPSATPVIAVGEGRGVTMNRCSRMGLHAVAHRKVDRCSVISHHILRSELHIRAGRCRRSHADLRRWALGPPPPGY